MLKFFVAAQSYAMNTYDGLRNRQEGQTMAEYGVVLAVITIAAVVVFAALSSSIKDALYNVIEVITPGENGPAAP